MEATGYWNGATKSQGMPEARQSWMKNFFRALEGVSLVNILNSYFHPSEL